MSYDTFKNDRFAEIVFHLRRGPVKIALADWMRYVYRAGRLAELARLVPGAITHRAQSPNVKPYVRLDTISPELYADLTALQNFGLTRPAQPERRR
jgi:hypothetical protein